MSIRIQQELAQRLMTEKRMAAGGKLPDPKDRPAIKLESAKDSYQALKQDNLKRIKAERDRLRDKQRPSPSLATKSSSYAASYRQNENFQIVNSPDASLSDESEAAAPAQATIQQLTEDGRRPD